MTVRGSRGVRVVVALLALALALAAAPAWGASGGANAKPAKLDAARLGPVRTGNGIVQAVRPHAVVVRLLDGRTLVVPVGPRTAVLVNGARAQLTDVRPGFVVMFKARARGAALTLRASGSAAGAGSTAAKPGTVQSVSPSSVVVTGQDGGTVTIAVGARTRVFLNNSPASITDITAGARLVKVGGDASGQRPARALRFRRPG